jgi:uncharacterized protein YjdB
MAKSRNNVITHGLSGKIGDLLVFRQRGGQTFVSKIPERPKSMSEKQIETQKRFQQAIIYAKAANSTPEMKERYAAKAKKLKGMTAYNVAVADFYNAPNIDTVDLSAYTGLAGDEIRVQTNVERDYNIFFTMKKIILILVFVFAFAMTVTTSCSKDKKEDTLPLTGITVTPTTVKLPVNGTATLKATPQPADAEDVSFSWSVNNTAKVSLSSTEGDEVSITALQTGTAVVTVSSGSAKATVTVTVTVEETPLTGITVTPTTVILSVNSTATLKATPHPADAEDVLFLWSVNNSVISLSSTAGDEVAITATETGTAVVTVVSVKGGFAKTTVAVAVKALSPQVRASTQDFMIYPYGRMTASDGFGFSSPGRMLGENGLFIDGTWGDMRGGDDVMRDYFECGFNATAYVESFYLPYAIPYNLTVMLQDKLFDGVDVDIRAGIQTLAETKIPQGYPNPIYLLAMDEPPAGDFPIAKTWWEASKEKGFTASVNLLPNYGTFPDQYGAPDYRTYLEKYITECHPEYLSYDHYAMYEGPVLREDQFYSNLEIMREMALKYSIPFWQIVEGCKYSDHAYPSPAVYNIQVFSTMAYGGRGISYWTYYYYSWNWCNGNTCDTRAPIVSGRRTKSWDYLRDVNMQIHALAPVYCTLKSVNVFHTNTIPRAASGISSSVYVQSVGEGNFLVGEFIDPAGTPYLFVVNKNLSRTVPVKISLKSGGRLMRVSPNGQGLEPYEGLQAQLAPGAGALLKIE